jgi:hypothetical protein
MPLVRSTPVTSGFASRDIYGTVTCFTGLPGLRRGALRGAYGSGLAEVVEPDLDAMKRSESNLH